jgi:hypothetical protein
MNPEDFSNFTEEGKRAMIVSMLLNAADCGCVESVIRDTEKLLKYIRGGASVRAVN